MRREVAGNLLYAAIGLAAFIATSALVHSVLPPMVPKGIAAKLKYFTEHKDEFDTVIVGTSHLYYSAAPEIFDATARESGLATRSFNFGIDGMHPPENFYVLEQILKTKPKNLKWVLLELGDIQTRWDNILGTERAVYWHDWPRTELTLRKAFDPRGNANWLIKLTRLWLARRDFISNLALFGKQFSNVGLAADLLPAANRERYADALPNSARAGTAIAGPGMQCRRSAPLVSNNAWRRRWPARPPNISIRLPRPDTALLPGESAPPAQNQSLLLRRPSSRRSRGFGDPPQPRRFSLSMMRGSIRNSTMQSPGR
jgi:hypothetical protein